jgi:hypothetical protein
MRVPVKILCKETQQMKAFVFGQGELEEFCEGLNQLLEYLQHERDRRRSREPHHISQHSGRRLLAQSEGSQHT